MLRSCLLSRAPCRRVHISKARPSILSRIVAEVAQQTQSCAALLQYVQCTYACKSDAIMRITKDIPMTMKLMKNDRKPDMCVCVT